MSKCSKAHMTPTKGRCVALRSTMRALLSLSDGKMSRKGRMHRGIRFCANQYRFHQVAERSQYENDRRWTHWLEEAWAAAQGCSLYYDSKPAMQPPNTCNATPNRERLQTCLSNSKGYALGLIRGLALKARVKPHKANGDMILTSGGRK